MVVCAVWGLALSCCKRTLFPLTNAGYLHLKFHKLIVVENKDLHTRFEHIPKETRLHNSIRHTVLLWGRTDLFNEGFGKLMGNEPLFRGISVAVIDPFFTTCGNLLINLSSMGLPTSWRHISTLLWACWGTDLQLLYDFPSVLIWWCMVTFDAPSSSDILLVLFFRFSSKTLHIFSISYYLGLPEHEMIEAFTAIIMIFIEQFRARWPWSISASHCSEHTYSDHSWRCLPQPGTKRRGEGILRMEDDGTSEEDDIDSQDSNTPIEHGHLAQNSSRTW